MTDNLLDLQDKVVNVEGNTGKVVNELSEQTNEINFEGNVGKEVNLLDFAHKLVKFVKYCKPVRSEIFLEHTFKDNAEVTEEHVVFSSLFELKQFG